MGRYSVIVNGENLDIHFRKVKGDIKRYSLWTGKIQQGWVFNMGRRGWSGVPCTPHALSPFDGFRSRYDAAFMILKAKGLMK